MLGGVGGQLLGGVGGQLLGGVDVECWCSVGGGGWDGCCFGWVGCEVLGVVLVG